MRFKEQVCCVECGALDSFIDISEADKYGWTVNRMAGYDQWICPKCLKRMVRAHETDEDYRSMHK